MDADVEPEPCRGCSTPINPGFGWCPECDRIEALRSAVNGAQESIEFVEGLLRNMRDNEALSASEYFALEGPLRFTRTNILNVE